MGKSDHVFHGVEVRVRCVGACEDTRSFVSNASVALSLRALLPDHSAISSGIIPITYSGHQLTAFLAVKRWRALCTVPMASDSYVGGEVSFTPVHTHRVNHRYTRINSASLELDSHSTFAFSSHDPQSSTRPYTDPHLIPSSLSPTSPLIQSLSNPSDSLVSVMVRVDESKHVVQTEESANLFGVIVARVGGVCVVVWIMVQWWVMCGACGSPSSAVAKKLNKWRSDMTGEGAETPDGVRNGSGGHNVEDADAEAQKKKSFMSGLCAGKSRSDGYGAVLGPVLDAVERERRERKAGDGAVAATVSTSHTTRQILISLTNHRQVEKVLGSVVGPLAQTTQLADHVSSEVCFRG